MSDDLKFTVQRPPAYGELTDMLPGLFWVRLPMPTAPNYINCWLLDNGPGWTMVDCGLNTDDSFELWDKLWRDCCGHVPCKTSPSPMRMPIISVLPDSS